METIDVLCAVTTLGPGGTEGYVEDLAIALARRGVRVAVMVDSGPCFRMPSLIAAGVPVQLLDLPAGSSRDEYIRRVDSVLTRYTVRLIHANVWAREEWLREVARKRNIPFVTTGHHTVPPVRIRDRLGLNRIPFHLYRTRRCLSRGNSGTICISDESLRNHRARYGADAAAVRVYCGRPETTIRARPETGGSAPVILWLGTLTERKRPLLAIAAFRDLLSKFSGCTLLMTGEGVLRTRVETEAQRLNGRVKLLGLVPSIEELLANASIILQTSANEGTPRVILEAMAVGLPVVATDAGATRELVINGETGLLVSVDHKTGLTAALSKLASNPAMRTRFGAAARKLYEEHFNCERMVDETIRAYSRLVGVSLGSVPVAKAR